MKDQEFQDNVDKLSDEQVHHIAQNVVNWSGPPQIDGEPKRDEDGFSVLAMHNYAGFGAMQSECWQKFNKNPQLNSHVRDYMGTLTGYGWDMSCDIESVDDVMYETIHDIRNELMKFFPKFIARSEIEGELFLALSVHPDGFVEIDFMEPSSLGGGGDYDSGIHYHPKKQTMPVFYRFQVQDANNQTITQVFPSIYVAHMPEIARQYPKTGKITPDQLKMAQGPGRKYAKIGGFRTFIIAWDRGFLTPRNLSHISTTIEWINHYVNLKKWEIDHKKSAGSYLWIVKMTDVKAFRTWLKMTDEEKQATGLTAKKTPGGTLILPPGVEIDCKNPNLPNISEQDTDIMHMITSGLNKPEDMVTGQTKGDTFSGINASRGPQSDRTQDQLAYFERFLRYDFWRSVFTLRNKIQPEFKLDYIASEAVAFKDGETVYKKRKKPAWEIIDFDFPQSEIGDVESKARALLGVKHPSVVEVLGIPRSVVAKKLGFGNYKKKRLLYETELDQYPELPMTAELDAMQESANEPSTDEDNKNTDKTNGKDDSSTKDSEKDSKDDKKSTE